MNAELTELVFILDRSGSMGGLESDTIGGYNSMLEKQKKQGRQVNVTTVLFDDRVEFIHDRFPIDIIEPLTEEDYYVRGCTALMDAVGIAIEKISDIQRRLPDTHRAGKIIFVIITDGLENSSKEFTHKRVKTLIEEKKAAGWEFLYLGANIDAGTEAEKIGIGRNRSVTYENDHEGVALNYEVVGRSICKMTMPGLSEAKLEDDWAEDIKRYHDSRKTKK
jgi:uncharacterized protein YegL